MYTSIRQSFQPAQLYPQEHTASAPRTLAAFNTSQATNHLKSQVLARLQESQSYPDNAHTSSPQTTLQTTRLYLFQE